MEVEKSVPIKKRFLDRWDKSKDDDDDCKELINEDSNDAKHLDEYKEMKTNDYLMKQLVKNEEKFSDYPMKNTANNEKNTAIKEMKSKDFIDRMVKNEDYSTIKSNGTTTNAFYNGYSQSCFMPPKYPSLDMERLVKASPAPEMFSRTTNSSRDHNNMPVNSQAMSSFINQIRTVQHELQMQNQIQKELNNRHHKPNFNPPIVRKIKNEEYSPPIEKPIPVRAVPPVQRAELAAYPIAADLRRNLSIEANNWEQERSSSSSSFDRSSDLASDHISNNGDNRHRKNVLLPSGCPLSEEQVVNSSIEEFNQHMMDEKFDDDYIATLRDCRRKGKNRQAARKSRQKKMDDLDCLESKKSRYSKETEDLENSIEYFKKVYEEEDLNNDEVKLLLEHKEKLKQLIKKIDKNTTSCCKNICSLV